jgi:hypothetical protein
LRRVVVSFKNMSSNMCMLVGYPDANLVTAAGGVLVHVEPRQALSGTRAPPQPGRCRDCGRRVVCARHQWVGKSLPSRRNLGGDRAERFTCAHTSDRAAHLQCDDQLGGLRPLLEELHQLFDSVLGCAPALT